MERLVELGRAITSSTAADQAVPLVVLTSTLSTYLSTSSSQSTSRKYNIGALPFRLNLDTEASTYLYTRYPIGHHFFRSGLQRSARRRADQAVESGQGLEAHVSAQSGRQCAHYGCTRSVFASAASACESKQRDASHHAKCCRPYTVRFRPAVSR